MQNLVWFQTMFPFLALWIHSKIPVMQQFWTFATMKALRQGWALQTSHFIIRYGLKQIESKSASERRDTVSTEPYGPWVTSQNRYPTKMDGLYSQKWDSKFQKYYLVDWAEHYPNKRTGIRLKLPRNFSDKKSRILQRITRQLGEPLGLASSK